MLAEKHKAKADLLNIAYQLPGLTNNAGAQNHLAIWGGEILHHYKHLLHTCGAITKAHSCLRKSITKYHNLFFSLSNTSKNGFMFSNHIYFIAYNQKWLQRTVELCRFAAKRCQNANETDINVTYRDIIADYQEIFTKGAQLIDNEDGTQYSVNYGRVQVCLNSL